MKFEFYGHIFSKKKSSSITFHEIRPVGTVLFHADGHEEADSCFTQFCEKRVNIYFKLLDKASRFHYKNQYCCLSNCDVELSLRTQWRHVGYCSDNSDNEDNSFRNHIR